MFLFYLSHDSKTALKSHFLCENAKILIYLYGTLLRMWHYVDEIVTLTPTRLKPTLEYYQN